MRFALSTRRLLASSRFLASTALGSQSDAVFTRRYSTNDSSTVPSKVLFLRTGAEEITQEELVNLVKPFGTINRFVVTRAGNQALLEMDDIEEAQNIIQCFNNGQARLRGREVHFEYSTHKELSDREDDKPGPGRVLFLTIHNPLYQINVDTLHQVFSPQGTIEKIVIFQKSAVQAFIVFESKADASKAKTLLHGRAIFDGCCKLDIEYSINQNINVVVNNDLSRDYTNDSLPTDLRKVASNSSILGSGEAYSTSTLGGVGGRGAVTSGTVPTSGVLPLGITGANTKSTLLVSNLDEKIDEDKIFNLFTSYGRILRIRRFENAGQALVQLGDGIQAELALNFLRGAPLYGRRLEITYSRHNYIRNPRTRDFSFDVFNRFSSDYIRNCSPPSNIIHVSNLNLDVEDGDLLNYLAPHGLIQKVKIFEFNGRKQALVEFDTVEQATEALACKNRTRLKNMVIRLAFSKYYQVR